MMMYSTSPNKVVQHVLNLVAVTFIYKQNNSAGKLPYSFLNPLQIVPDGNGSSRICSDEPARRCSLAEVFATRTHKAGNLIKADMYSPWMATHVQGLNCKYYAERGWSKIFD